MRNIKSYYLGEELLSIPIGDGTITATVFHLQPAATHRFLVARLEHWTAISGSGVPVHAFVAAPLSLN